LYEECRGEDREQLRDALLQFEQAITKQQVRDFSTLRSSFAAFLDSFEG
jgi:hypothetical protein